MRKGQVHLANYTLRLHWFCLLRIFKAGFRLFWIFHKGMQIHVAKPSPKWWNCFSPKSNGKPWRIHTFNLILDQWQVLRIIGMRFAAFVNERCSFSRKGKFPCFVNIWKTRSIYGTDESVEAFGGSHQSFISNFADMLPFRLALLQTREGQCRNGTVLCPVVSLLLGKAHHLPTEHEARDKQLSGVRQRWGRGKEIKQSKGNRGGNAWEVGILT